jgi:hypothetical protein
MNYYTGMPSADLPEIIVRRCLEGGFSHQQTAAELGNFARRASAQAQYELVSNRSPFDNGSTPYLLSTYSHAFLDALRDLADETDNPVFQREADITAAIIGPQP